MGGVVPGSFAVLCFLCRRFPASAFEQWKPKRMGTAKFDAWFSVKTAKLTPITRPDGPKSGAPDPPSAVRASYTIRRTSRSVMLPCGQRLNAFRFREIFELGHRRAVALLNSSRLRIVEQRQQSIRAGRITHHHDRLADCDCVGISFQRQNRNRFRDFRECPDYKQRGRLFVQRL